MLKKYCRKSYSCLINLILGLILLFFGKQLFFEPPKIMKIDSIFVNFFYVALTVSSITIGVLLIGLVLYKILEIFFNLFKNKKEK